MPSRDGGCNALYAAAYTVDTAYPVDFVFTVAMVYTVAMVLHC